jgi:hypothetical protein
MLHKSLHIFFLVLIIIIASFNAFAQQQTPVGLNDVNAEKNQALQEKIFAHTDKEFYLAGEILWFKLYDVSADSLKLLDVSKIAYVEILNAQQKSVLQATIALNNGSGNGSFYLPSSITSGNYVLRAYTNWMKNFDADKYFQKKITIVNTLTPITKTAEENFDGYEINFFPEGGNFVTGLESKVSFKVTDKYGNGINCSGNIVDEKNQTTTPFNSVKFGMGSFYFKPEENHTYNAILNINNKPVSKQLPAINTKGFVMHVSYSDDKELTVSVHSNAHSQQTVYLLAYHNKKIDTSLMKNSDADGSTLFNINRNDLAAGITRLIIFNNEKKPVCERLIFIKPESMRVKISADKNIYTTRSEVKMNVSADSDYAANLSMSVYLIDSLQLPDDNNILNYLWLTSELKGRIQSPQYYFSNNNAETDSALENLLLTQGWSRFKTEDFSYNNETIFKYAPEMEGHLIEGKVIDKNSGLAAAHIRVYLSVPGQHFRFSSALSNDNGNVFFDVKDFYGAGELVVQTGKGDSMYRVDIANPFSNQTYSWNVAPLNLNESDLQLLTHHNLAMQVQNAYTINQLNTFNQPALDSNAFFGSPDAKYFLDNYVRFNSMEEVLREYIPEVGVRIRQGNYSLTTIDTRNHGVFENNPLVLVDGVPIFDMNKLIAYNPLKIKKAEIVTRKYYINSLTVNGILSYSTYKGDLDGLQFDAGTTELSYEGLQLQREFYSPQYTSAIQQQNRLPDYRNVLYWSPQITTNAQISFYTSDIKGKYIAILQGVDENGKAGYSTTEFEVK